MDHAAFEKFYAETATRLWAYLLRICNNRESARDILQESYLRFLQRPPRGTAPEQLKSYLYTIATRLHLSQQLGLMAHRLKARRDGIARGVIARGHQQAEEIPKLRLRDYLAVWPRLQDHMQHAGRVPGAALFLHHLFCLLCGFAAAVLSESVLCCAVVDVVVVQLCTVITWSSSLHPDDRYAQ